MGAAGEILLLIPTSLAISFLKRTIRRPVYTELSTPA